jgi:hypothetical protein
MPAIQVLSWAGGLAFTVGAAADFYYFGPIRAQFAAGGAGAGEALMAAAAALLLAAAGTYSAVAAPCALGPLPGLGTSRGHCFVVEQDPHAEPPQEVPSRGGAILQVRAPAGALSAPKPGPPLGAAFSTDVKMAISYVERDRSVREEAAREGLRAAAGALRAPGVGARPSEAAWRLAAGHVRAAMATEAFAAGEGLLVQYLKLCLGLTGAPGEAGSIAVHSVVWAAPRVALPLDDEHHLRGVGAALAAHYALPVDVGDAACADIRAFFVELQAPPPQRAVERLLQLCDEQALGRPEPAVLALLG